jgi:hypothetical protein
MYSQLPDPDVLRVSGDGPRRAIVEVGHLGAEDENARQD